MLKVVHMQHHAHTHTHKCTVAWKGELTLRVLQLLLFNLHRELLLLAVLLLQLLLMMMMLQMIMTIVVLGCSCATHVKK